MRFSQSLMAALAITAGASELLAAPKITKIDGPSDNVTVVAGRINASVGTNYNGYLVIAEASYATSYRLTIYGTGFGTTPGSVKFGDRAVKVMANGWKPSAIVLETNGAEVFGTKNQWEWGAVSGTITVTTADPIPLKAPWSDKWAPALANGRCMGQCTHKVCAERYRNGKTPSAKAYEGYTSFSPTWVPQAWDQLKLPVKGGGYHNAIISAVTKKTSGTLTTYTLTIIERNALGRNEDNSYTTTFTVNGKAFTVPGGSNSSILAADGYYR